MKKIFCLLIVLNFGFAAQASEPAKQLVQGYKANASEQISVQAGEALWRKTMSHDKTPVSRNCASCHTKSLIESGRHIKTKKIIDPIAPSVNSKRFTDIKKIKKWLKRNCKWTYGRECSDAEKGSLLMFLMTQ